MKDQIVLLLLILHCWETEQPSPMMSWKLNKSVYEKKPFWWLISKWVCSTGPSVVVKAQTVQVFNGLNRFRQCLLSGFEASCGSTGTNVCWGNDESVFVHLNVFCPVCHLWHLQQIVCLKLSNFFFYQTSHHMYTFLNIKIDVGQCLCVSWQTEILVYWFTAQTVNTCSQNAWIKKYMNYTGYSSAVPGCMGQVLWNTCLFVFI